MPEQNNYLTLIEEGEAILEHIDQSASRLHAPLVVLQAVDLEWGAEQLDTDTLRDALAVPSDMAGKLFSDISGLASGTPTSLMVEKTD
ncbi:MAG: hypothetical protein ABFS02_11990 [Pseudomonadota bacterium]